MNLRVLAYILGWVLSLEAAFMIPPMLISYGAGEAASASAFLLTIAIVLAIGVPCILFRPKKINITAKQGLVVVGLSWIALSLFGGLPFFFSGSMPNFMDAFFESVSGFTTTGASILTDIEALDMGILFWRSFTHWIGGMGVLVFVLAVVSLAGGNSMHILRAESPGPDTGKIVPRMKKSAIILYVIYLGLTVLEIILLVAGGMPLFDSVCHAFGTAGTGGFSIKNASIAAYSSEYLQWVITIFMILFGINFNIYYLLLVRNFKNVLKNEELRVYIGIIVVSIVIIAINISGTIYNTVEESVRYAAFQVGSIITTTGYATADFNLWPQLSRMLLVVLMILGASSGSTGGGIKTSRAIIIFKSAKREISRMISPKSVQALYLNGRPLEEAIVRNTNIFFGTYIMLIIGFTLIVSLDAFDFETTFTSVLACINNIGPGLNMVGATGNYSEFSELSKGVLSFSMLVGRLEIFPMIALLAPSVWKLNKNY